MRHDSFQFLLRPLAFAGVCLAQLGAQQVIVAKDVQWQIAVAVIVAVEESTFLMPVQRIVSGVQVKHDLLRL